MAVSKTANIQIPALNRQIMKVRIRGLSPLVFHAWDEKTIRMMLDKQMKKADKGRAVRDPQVEFAKSFYLNEEGQIAFPTRNIKQAIVGSARFLNSVAMTVLRGTVFVWGSVPEAGRPGVKASLVPVLVDGKPATLSGEVTMFDEPGGEDGKIVGHDAANPKILMRRDTVTVGMGSADLRFRGQLSEWEMELFIEFDADILSAEQVLNLLQRAGFSQGIGEWRPEKSGEFGSFEIVTEEEA